MRRALAVTSLVGIMAAAPAARAQDAPRPAAAQPPAKPSPFSGDVSLGFGLTSGNKDTATFNGSYEVKFDPRTRNVVKSSGLFLYGKTDGELTTEQYRLAVRDEYTFDKRAFVFGELHYLHDRFKGIKYLFAPAAGAGYKIIDGKARILAVSGGVGGVFEQDYDVPITKTGAVTFEEKFTWKFSKSAAVGQSFSTLWDIKDFGDGLYLLGVNLTAALIGRAQLKVEALDSYKSRPPQPALQQNDVTFITGIVLKF